MDGLSGELYLQIRRERGRSRGRVLHLGAHTDQRELRGAGYLEHARVAAGVAGVEGFDRHVNQKAAGSGLAGAVTGSLLADALGPVQRMSDAIGQGGMIQNPFGGRGVERRRKKQRGQECFAQENICSREEGFQKRSDLQVPARAARGGIEADEIGGAIHPQPDVVGVGIGEIEDHAFIAEIDVLDLEG